MPREGTRVGGDPRYARPDDPAAVAANRLLATFTVAELLRNGVTTFMEFGSQRRVQEALVPEVERLGIRGYLGAGYDSGRWVGAARDGRLTRAVDEAAGAREFESALEFLKQVNGAAGDRLRGLLAPREVETCSLELLRATRKAADELGMPIVTHAAYNVHEFFQIVTEHRMTPIELLDSIGFLGRDVTIGHGNLIADNALLSYSGGRDLELMAFHPLGTARAGGDPRRAVLDADLAVRGVAGVHVADGSAVPSSLGVNPQITIMALATRLAFHLLGAPSPDGEPEPEAIARPRITRPHALTA